MILSIGQTSHYLHILFSLDHLRMQFRFNHYNSVSNYSQIPSTMPLSNFIQCSICCFTHCGILLRFLDILTLNLIFLVCFTFQILLLKLIDRNKYQILKYAFTQPLHIKQDVTQDQFLSRIQLV